MDFYTESYLTLSTFCKAYLLLTSLWSQA